MTVAANSAFSRDIARVLHPYTHLKKHEQNGPLIIARGEGIRVIDEDGKSYIDGLAGSVVRLARLQRAAACRSGPAAACDAALLPLIRA